MSFTQSCPECGDPHVGGWRLCECDCHFPELDPNPVPGLLSYHTMSALTE